MGWSTGDILTGHGIFVNAVKAEVFLGLYGGEDEEMWLRSQIRSYLA